ncbi:MAG TPA: stage II sporulation protein M, partial [Acidimicrobiales bacterium]|nr:stage II sporulation protein M [Acidimicrobiales bacterium]
ATELDQFIRLYQRTSTHLSYAQTNFADPGLVAQLSRLVASAGAVIYGSRPWTLRSFGRFFTRTFPAALWRVRRFVIISAVLTFGPAIAVGTWLANSPKAVQATGPAAVREAYVNQDFESYYSSQPAAAFATEVYTNNVRVALLAFAGGILLCVPTAYLLVTNGVSLGGAAGLFAAAGQSSKFYGLILPHGLIELTSVVIAGAAGLRLGWTVIDPGDRTRAAALADEGRRAVVLVLGVVGTLLIAGIIEGFVTGSGLPTPVRVGIGATVEIAFLAYVVTIGRLTAAQGWTGALGEGERGPVPELTAAPT